MTAFDISWTAPEYEERAKSVNWYWASIVIAVLALTVAVWQRNFLFAVFIIIAEILVLFWGNQPPRRVEFRMTDRGLTIDKRIHYGWTEIDSFSVEDQGPEDAAWVAVVFRFQRRLKPSVQIRAPQERIGEIQQNLAALLPRTPWEEHLVDTLEKFVRF